MSCTNLITTYHGGNPSYLIQYYFDEKLQSSEQYQWIPLEKDYKYLSSVLEGKKKDPDLVNAIKIYSSLNQKIIINSFLIIETPKEELSIILEMDTAIIDAYKKYLFKTNIWTSKLEKVAYINALDEVERTTYQYGLKFGKDFLKWKFCGASIQVGNVREEMEELFTLAKYNAKIAAMNPITGEASKEALKWMANSIKLADAISKFDSNKQLSESLEEAAAPGALHETQIIKMLVQIQHSDDVGSLKDFSEEEIG